MTSHLPSNAHHLSFTRLAGSSRALINAHFACDWVAVGRDWLVDVAISSAVRKAWLERGDQRYGKVIPSIALVK
jgi:hypothetical protein